MLKMLVVVGEGSYGSSLWLCFEGGGFDIDDIDKAFV